MSDLRISGFSIDLVRWPLKMKRRHGVGDIAESMPGVIVRIDTDAGISGWGEAAPWSVFTGTAEANAIGLHAYARPLLIGADPFAVSTLMNRIEHALVGHTEGKAAVEMALLDIVGKRLGTPVSALLGGAMRDTVPLSVSIANPDFDADVALATRLCREGINIYKVKTAVPVACRRPEAPGTAAPRTAGHGRSPGRLQPGPRTLGRGPQVARHRSLPPDLHRAAGAARPARRDGGDHRRDRHADHGRRKRLLPGRGYRDGAARNRRPGQHQDHEIGRHLPRPRDFGDCGGGRYCRVRRHDVRSRPGDCGRAADDAATQNISLGAEFYTSTYLLGAEILTRPIEIAAGATRVPTGPGLGVEIDPDAVRRVSVGHWD